MYRYAAMLLKM